MSIRGIGTDIVEISRVKKQLSRNDGEFARYILADIELEEFSSCKEPSRFLAKRFAAKEAASKALGTGFSQGVSLKDFVVGHDKLGKPILILKGRAEVIACVNNVTSFYLSLSDEKHYATAMVIFES